VIFVFFILEFRTFQYLKYTFYKYSKTYLNRTPGTEKFVQFRQVFGLHRFKLHRHLVDGIVKCVCRFSVYTGFGLDRFHCSTYIYTVHTSWVLVSLYMPV